jgi:hypothetical protein
LKGISKGIISTCLIFIVVSSCSSVLFLLSHEHWAPSRDVPRKARADPSGGCSTQSVLATYQPRPLFS